MLEINRAQILPSDEREVFADRNNKFDSHPPYTSAESAQEKQMLSAFQKWLCQA